MIHRDIKPTNLFLMNTGVVKVLDLGFGELVGQTAPAIDPYDTDLGVVVGTTDFMSPEQVKQRPIDARSDLFSLGCTMYRLLTGNYAFPGVTREDRLIKRIKERHHPITEVRPGLPERLVAIVDRRLAIQPNDRFGSAAEAAETLEALIAPAEDSGSSDKHKTGGQERPCRCTAGPSGTRGPRGLGGNRIGAPPRWIQFTASTAPSGTDRVKIAREEGHHVPSQGSRRRGRRIGPGSPKKISE